MTTQIVHEVAAQLRSPGEAFAYLTAWIREAAQTPVGAIDAQIRAVEAAENQVAAAILARQFK